MAINGFINTEVKVSQFNEPQTMYREGNFRVDTQPVGSTYSFSEIQNGDVTEIYLRADLVGTYEISWDWDQDAQNPEDEDHGVKSDSVILTIDSSGNITQTHQNWPNEASNCDEFSIKVTGSVEFNEINGDSIPSTLEHIIQKKRSENLLVNIKATVPANGESSLINTNTVQMMAELITVVTNMDVVVSQPPGYAQWITYDFGEGAGYQSIGEHHYTTPGDKTILAKDLWGCIKTIFIHVGELVPLDPHDYPSIFYISKANPIRFALMEGVGICGNYINDENSFGCETPFVGIKYEDIQRIRKCWNIKNQFKSGYDTNIVHLYNAKTHQVIGASLPVTEVVKNIGYTDSRPYLYNEDATYSFLYFDEFAMIPSFYEIGGIITIGTESRSILDIVYLELEDIWAIKTLKVTHTASLLEYTYNREDVNVYEFDLDSMNLIPGEYYLEILSERTSASDPAENKIITHRSNTFDIQFEFERTVDIVYANNTNNDIYWAGGMIGFFTVGLDYRIEINDHENEVIKTDNSSYLKKSFAVEKFEFLFEPLTQEIAVKLKYTLSQYHVAINGVLYSFEEIGFESIDTNTNDYIVKATGIKSNKNINFINYLEKFDWSSSTVKWDSSITFDSTIK